TVGHSPFMKYLSEIKKGDLVLMCSDFFLLPQGSWPQGEYNLTITMFGEDFELSGSVLYTVD
ncbi:MAG: hypothetical protein LUE10_06370, partial [Alistipes sp.]|nr:hypothetical protein [Alistipes sp.]